MSEMVITILSSSVVAAMLTSLVGAIFKDFIFEKLKKSYSTELKVLENELKSKTDKELKILENELKSRTDKEVKLLENELKRTTELELAKNKNDLSLQLEISKLKLGPYSKEQFDIYNKLWVCLCELKGSMLRLWTQASEEHLEDFSKKIEETTLQLEKSALIVEEQHYMELITILNEFSYYQIGKLTLIEYRRETPRAQFDSQLINQMVNENMMVRDRLLNFLQQIRNCLRLQISSCGF